MGPEGRRPVYNPLRTEGAFVDETTRLSQCSRSAESVRPLLKDPLYELGRFKDSWSEPGELVKGRRRY